MEPQLLFWLHCISLSNGQWRMAKEAYSAITGKKTDEDIQNEKELKELGLDSEDQ